MFDFVSSNNWQKLFAIWIWIPVCLGLLVFWVIKIKRSMDEELKPNRYVLEDANRDSQ